MDGGHPRCCGIDVHKRMGVACLLVSDPGKPLGKEVRTCGTMTADLVRLADWRTGG